MNVNKKVQLDATVCRHVFTAQSLYMFQVSQHPSSGLLKTVSATSGIGHGTGTATSFQHGLIGTGHQSQHPSSGVLKTVSATSGIGRDTGTATSFQHGLIRTGHQS
jgi:ABC-type phosphonate transport system ATPase subunit